MFNLSDGEKPDISMADAEAVVRKAFEKQEDQPTAEATTFDDADDPDFQSQYEDDHDAETEELILRLAEVVRQEIQKKELFGKKVSVVVPEKSGIDRDIVIIEDQEPDEESEEDVSKFSLSFAVADEKGSVENALQENIFVLESKEEEGEEEPIPGQKVEFDQKHFNKKELLIPDYIIALGPAQIRELSLAMRNPGSLNNNLVQAYLIRQLIPQAEAYASVAAAHGKNKARGMNLKIAKALKTLLKDRESEAVAEGTWSQNDGLAQIESFFEELSRKM